MDGTSPARPHVLGIDTGGTYTDAVLLARSTGRVVATAKALTTYPDPSAGIIASVQALGTPLTTVARVCLSTTLATNALVEGLGARVGLLLLGFSPALFARPEYASQLPDGPRAFLPGQMSAGGSELEPLDDEAVERTLAGWRGRVDAVAVCGIFSIRNPEHELRVAEIAREVLPVPLVASHTISDRLDAIARATTCAFNARLLPVVHRFLDALRPALGPLGMAAETPLFLVRGDGCLMTEELSRRKPLETFLSGPASSAMGAAYLAGAQRAVVLDIGGTTSDIALLANGEVLLSHDGAVVGGLRTHIPGLHGTTLGLGGDSHVRPQPDGTLLVGPRRVVPVSLATRTLGLPLSEVRERRVWLSDGLPDFVVATGAEVPDASRLERALLDAVGSVPISVERLARRLELAAPLLLPLSRLLASRALLPIGPTPTDILAAVGEVTHVDPEAARSVAGRLADAIDLDCGELARRLRAEIGAQLADAIARTCLARSHPSAVWEKGAATALEAPQPGAFLELTARLDAPLVGLGAPAGQLVPRAAGLLGTECLIPPGAEVGGAIGAATAAVRGIVRVTVRAAYGTAGISHYVVHSRLRPEFYEEREPALLRAREIAGALAREEALAGEPAGTDGIAVSFEAEESTARDAGGSQLWLESRIRATARVLDAAGATQ